MSNIIYILSMITASVWMLSYFLINDAPPAIHVLIVAAFAGIVASLFLDDKKVTETIKDNKNLHV